MVRRLPALDIKLVRDFRRLWLQGLAIAMVLACGVAILLTAFGMHTALTDTRDAYYERNRFADVFAAARRAPDALMTEIRAIPGVIAAEARMEGLAVLDLPGRTRTAMGLFLSWPEHDAPLLNVPVLQSGLYPEAAGEVMVTRAFAEANGFAIGDVFHANLNGQRRALTITGTAMSPEFIYTIGPGALMPDNEGYGVIWMPEAEIAAAFDLSGAFNSVALKLGRTASEAEVIARLDRILADHGGLGATGRDVQVSDSFVSAEIDQLRGMAVVIPPVFFAISAFLVGMVMSRIVALERAEIGLLKALGYSGVEICLHYLLLAALIAVIGIAIGWGLGSLLARAMAGQYARFFDFPYLLFRVPAWVYAMSGIAALLTTMLGALRAAWAAARIAPAVAMQPPAPPVFRKTAIDRAMAALRLRQTSVMVLRSLIRWPVRSALMATGLGAATAAIISSSFMIDALDKVVDLAFNQAMRQDAMVLFTQEVPDTAIADLRRLPGVLQVEPQQVHTAILRHGPRQRRVAIEARPQGAELSRIMAADGRAIDPPAGGILLSARLAEALALRPGDRVEAEFLTGPRDSLSLTVTGISEQYLGLGAYMDMRFLDAQFRRSPQMSMGNVLLDPARTEELHAALQDMPGLSGMIEIQKNRAAFEDTINQNVTVINAVYAAIAICITIGVAYNGARILLSERARELASLRILGFTRAEVSSVLIGETMLLAVLAQPVGWLLGAWIASTLAGSFTSDLYTIPLVLKPASFAYASLIVLVTSLLSVLVVRRRIDRMDLVTVMKTRE